MIYWHPCWDILIPITHYNLLWTVGMEKNLLSPFRIFPQAWGVFVSAWQRSNFCEISEILYAPEEGTYTSLKRKVTLSLKRSRCCSHSFRIAYFLSCSTKKGKYFIKILGPLEIYSVTDTSRISAESTSTVYKEIEETLFVKETSTSNIKRRI